MTNRHFTLRTIMTAVVVWGLLLARVRERGSWEQVLYDGSRSVFVWAAGLAVGSWIGMRWTRRLLGRRFRTSTMLLLGVSSAITIYLAWAHQRARGGSAELFRGFLYPDPAINAMERWFAARRPPLKDRNSFYICGCYDQVAMILGLAVIASSTVAGFLLGLVIRRPEPPAVETIEIQYDD